MDSVLGTDFDLSSAQGFRESGKFLQTVNGNTVTFNFGDGLSSLRDCAVLHWFANKYNMPELSVYQRDMQTTNYMYDEFLFH